MNVGEHCSESTCNQLDFLPIRCEHCGKIFCKLHASLAAHDCKSFDNRVGVESSKHFNVPNCEFENCRQHDLVPLTCEACGGHFCIAHKQKETHNCTALVTASQLAQTEHQQGLQRVAQHLDRDTLTEVSRPLHSRPALNASESCRSVRRTRPDTTAARLALIKTKMNAKPAGRGASQLPHDQRFVLQLTLSDQLLAPQAERQVHAFYFSLTWPLGKVLDFAVDVFAVKRPTTGQPLKLFRLPTDESDAAVSALPSRLDLSLSLGDAANRGDIREGCTIQLSA